MFSAEALKRQVNTVVAAVLCVGIGVLFLVYRSALPSDLLFTISIGSQVLLVVMGVLVALHEDWAKRHRWIVIGAFAAVGLAGFYTAVRDNRELTKERIQSEVKADAANAKLSDSMERLGTQTGEIQRNESEVKRDESEIKRIAGLNTELQNKLLGQSGQLLDSSRRITDLSKQGIDVTTGGDSFCVFIAVPNLGQGSPVKYPMIVNVIGKYPMSNVSAQIQKAGDSADINPFLAESTPHVPLGSGPLLPGPHPIYNYSLGDGVYGFGIWSRNGFIAENLTLQTINGELTQRIEVYRNGKKIYSDLPGQKPKITPQ